MISYGRGLGSLYDILDPLNPQYTLPTLKTGVHIPVPTQQQLDTLSPDELMSELGSEGWNNYISSLKSDSQSVPNVVTVNPYQLVNDATGSIAREAGNAVGNFSLSTWLIVGGVAVAGIFGLKLLREI